MIPFSHIKTGNYFKIRDGETLREGIVRNIDLGSKQVEVYNGIQDFWYNTEELVPIIVDDFQLKRLQFTAEPREEGGWKYKKGAFRIYLPQEGRFDQMTLKYRDEVRHIHGPMYVHELQNHFHEMTKVLLDDTVYA